METKTKKFLAILQIELEDLIADLEFNKDVLEKRLSEREITEYVFLENIGLIKKEILGIERVKRMLKEPGSEVSTVEELHQKIEDYFHDKIKAAGLPNVVFLLVSRKLAKVRRYMAIGD